MFRGLGVQRFGIRFYGFSGLGVRGLGLGGVGFRGLGLGFRVFLVWGLRLVHYNPTRNPSYTQGPV